MTYGLKSWMLGIADSALLSNGRCLDINYDGFITFGRHVDAQVAMHQRGAAVDRHLRVARLDAPLSGRMRGASPRMSR